MRAIFYLLISLLIVPIVYAEVFPQAFSTSLTVNANNCTIFVDVEDNNADFDFNITAPLCNVTNTSNTFTYSKQVSPLFVRNVTCGETDLENLTGLCVEYFGQTDYIGNFTACKESKGRLEENYDEVHTKWESAESWKTNTTNQLTECNTQLTGCKEEGVKRNADINTCYTERNAFEVSSQKHKTERWTFAGIGIGIGLLLYHLWQRKGAHRNPKQDFPKQEKVMGYDPGFEEKLKNA